MCNFSEANLESEGVELFHFCEVTVRNDCLFPFSSSFELMMTKTGLFKPNGQPTKIECSLVYSWLNNVQLFGKTEFLMLQNL